MTKPVIKITVISDVVCPWCYIGKRRLEKAMHKVSDKYDFDVEYFPFELNPQMPAEGMNQKRYLTDKFGEQRYTQITTQVTQVAAQEGLKFDFASQQISPNTRNAHRLVQLAKDDGKQLELTEALFKAYFTDGVDLSRNENLVDVAEKAGMDRSKAELFLNSDTGSTEVEMIEKELQQLGITGVPFYIINNKYGISGAQPSEEFVKAFEESTLSSTQAAEACDIDKKNC